MPTGYQEKIVSIERLLEVVAATRAAGKTVVHCHGCFDIVHPGHIRYLEFARRQGDLLIVSVTGDSDVGKGDLRPYIPQDLRAENLAALVFVDFVCVNTAATAEDLLARVKPDVYVKGREYEDSQDPGFLAERGVVEKCGGRMIFSSGEVVFSSTDLGARMPKGSDTQRHRLQRVCLEHDISLATLEPLLERFRDMSVLVVGDVIVDRYVICDAIGVASEAPVLSLVHRDERSYVGGAAIVARHARALGAHPFLLTGGADDALTDMVRGVLQAEGVEHNFVQSRPSLVEKTRFIAEDTKVFKVDRARKIPLDSVTERRAATLLEQQARIADAVILCDFGYGMMTGSLLARALPAIRQNVRIVSADVSGGRANLLHFRNVDLLCPTEREARIALNDYDSGVSTVAWNVLNRTQARHLIVTLEKRGLLAFERRSHDRASPDWSARLQSEQLPSFADQAVDHLGCGDALLAAATLALTAGASLVQAAYLGNAAAAIEAATPGNQPVPAQRLQSWLQSREELLEGQPKSANVRSVESTIATGSSRYPRTLAKQFSSMAAPDPVGGDVRPAADHG